MANTAHLPDNDSKDQPKAVASLLDRHKAFWTRRETSIPLLCTSGWEHWKPYPPFVVRGGGTLPDGAEIRPGLLDPLANLEVHRPSIIRDGDFICGWGPYDNCWAEAILGCRVKRVGPSVWSEPMIQAWDKIDDVPVTGSKPWLDELLEVNRTLVKEAKNVHPVCQPLLRGPLDMAEASVPSELLYSSFHEQPAQLRRFLGICADLFIAIAQRWLSVTPRFYGGYSIRQEWGLWAPGTTVQFQADTMRNLSCLSYRDFMFEIDRRIASQFEYPIMHTHSGSAHMLAVLLDEPELKAIEVTIDPEPYGPPPLQLLTWFKRVQQAGKSLLINGPMTHTDLQTILRSLSPIGLAVRARLLSE